jgi:hypothetical protein
MPEHDHDADGFLKTLRNVFKAVIFLLKMSPILMECMMHLSKSVWQQDLKQMRAIKHRPQVRGPYLGQRD